MSTFLERQWLFSANDPEHERFVVFQRYPRATRAFIGVVLVTAIAAIDWVTGPDMSVNLLYVLAVMGMTWTGTRRHGMQVATLAAAESLATDLFTNARHSDLVLAWNVVTRLGVLMLVAYLLGTLRHALAEQQSKATTDALTGALNRRAFMDIADRERAIHARNGRPLSVAYFDVDLLKEANDRYGHQAGDDLLRTFAESVKDSLRTTDVIGRFGGDEFIVMLPDTDAQEAISAMHRVRQELADATTAVGVPVTASVGIVTYLRPPEQTGEMISFADELMYRAKNAGRNRMVGAVMGGSLLDTDLSVFEKRPTVV